MLRSLTSCSSFALSIITCMEKKRKKGNKKKKQKKKEGRRNRRKKREEEVRGRRIRGANKQKGKLEEGE